MTALDAVRERAAADEREAERQALSYLWHRWYDAVLKAKDLRRRFSDNVGIPEAEIAVTWRSGSTMSCRLWLSDSLMVVAIDGYRRAGDAAFWHPKFWLGTQEVRTAADLLAAARVER